MTIRIYLLRYHPEEGSRPLIARGRIIGEEVARADIDLVDGDYVTRISVFDGEHEHPLSDTPFTIGAGQWIWIPDAIAPDDDEDQASAVPS